MSVLHQRIHSHRYVQGNQFPNSRDFILELSITLSRWLVEGLLRLNPWDNLAIERFRRPELPHRCCHLNSPPSIEGILESRTKGGWFVIRSRSYPRRTRYVQQY